MPALPKPPVLRGLPLMGNLLEYQKHHVNLFHRGYELYGPIFTVSFGPQKSVVLVGPEYHRFFFSEVDKKLSMEEVYKFVIPMFGQILNSAPELARKNQLSILQKAFRGKNMATYVDKMVHETLLWLDTLGDEGVFELWYSFEKLSMHIAASSLMGRELREHIDQFLPLYHDLANGMEFILPPNLPLPRFRRRDRARVALAEMIRPLIQKRRQPDDDSYDFMKTLATSTYPNGAEVSEEVMVGLALMMVFGAYETTTAQNCWVLIQLLQNPAYLQRVLDEQEDVLGNRPENIALETLSRLDVLDRALTETERMRPVFSHYARANAVDFELGGYHIPKGWWTTLCPSVSHHLPEIFADPYRYDPDRFGPERQEDKKNPYGLIGFGGGYYKCPGMRFGTYEMKVIQSLILQQFELELVDPEPQADFGIGIIRPKPPTYIRYRRRTAAARGRDAFQTLPYTQPQPYAERVSSAPVVSARG